MCDSCEVIRINGVPCHEHGCPKGWIDPATGAGYPVPCWECGCDFVPEDRPNKWSKCPDCLSGYIADGADCDYENCGG